MSDVQVKDGARAIISAGAVSLNSNLTPEWKQKLLETLLESYEPKVAISTLVKLAKGINLSCKELADIQQKHLTKSSNARPQVTTLGPACYLGYTENQVREMMGSRFDRFLHWMRGQTVALCELHAFNHETREYEATNCTHESGVTIYYPQDVDRFLQNPNAAPLD